MIYIIKQKKKKKKCNLFLQKYIPFYYLEIWLP